MLIKMKDHSVQLSRIYRYKHSSMLMLAIISILVSGCGGGGTTLQEIDFMKG
jgi:hypothetical protein